MSGWDSGEGAGWNEGGDTTDNRGTAANGASGGDNWNGADTAATNGNDFDAVGHDQANGELTENGSGGGGDFTCRSCGEAGHKARDCPTKPQGENNGKCFNCDQEGHNKAECPNPRVFKGTCRVCNQVGHPAAQCPEKPPPKCFNCKQEGHITSECKNNRVFDTEQLPNLSADEAWDRLLKADSDCDLDDFRTALKIYSKACPDATYPELERAFRLAVCNVHLVALEKEIPKTFTHVNLQGELDKTYQIGFYLSAKPKRARAGVAWPKDAEENLERLKDAGLPFERGIPKCSRCDELGHVMKNCPEDPVESTDRVQVRCVNCDEIGHRARNCTAPRKDRFACRNCKQSGHKAEECTEPRDASDVECRKCNQMGHFSKDCPTGGNMNCRNCGEEGHISKECDRPKNPENVTCRNCEKVGHFSRDCPEPKDWSKVKCSQCGEMGHTIKRCKNIPADGADDSGYGGGGYDNAGSSFDQPASAAGGDGWGNGESTSGGNDDSWNEAPAAVTAGDGGAW